MWGRVNEVLLRAVAASGDGNHFFVETTDQLGPFMEMELIGLRATQGKGVRLEMVAAAGVRLEWLGEIQLDETGRLKLGDLVAQCPLQRVLRLHVPAGHRGPLLKAVLRWQCAPDGGARELVLELSALSEAERTLLRVDQEVVAQVAVAELARLRAQAMVLLRQDEEKAALALLQQALGLAELPADDRVDLEDLIRTVEQGNDSSGHKKAAMSGHAYRFGHGSGHYKQQRGSGPYVLEMIPNWLYILERHAHEPEVAMSMAVTNTVEPQSLRALVGTALGASARTPPGLAVATRAGA